MSHPESGDGIPDGNSKKAEWPEKSGRGLGRAQEGTEARRTCQCGKNYGCFSE